MAMKSTSQGTVRCRIRSDMKKTAPLRTPTSSGSRRSQNTEISSPSSAMRACSVDSSIRISPTPRSSSVRVAIDLLALVALSPHPWIFHDSGDANNRVFPYDERPIRTLAARDLGVHEHVLDLLAS